VRWEDTKDAAPSGARERRLTGWWSFRRRQVRPSGCLSRAKARQVSTTIRTRRRLERAMRPVPKADAAVARRGATQRSLRQAPGLAPPERRGTGPSQEEGSAPALCGPTQAQRRQAERRLRARSGHRSLAWAERRPPCPGPRDRPFPGPASSPCLSSHPATASAPRARSDACRPGRSTGRAWETLVWRGGPGQRCFSSAPGGLGGEQTGRRRGKEP
jgi:hypothetical protein